MQIILKIYTVILLCFSFNESIAQVFQESDIEKAAIELAEKIDKTNIQNLVVANFNCYEDTMKNQCNLLGDEFSFNLSSTNKNFKVVDRSQIKLLFKESELAENSILDPNTIVKLGNVQGIDGIVTGSLHKIDNQNYKLFINLLELETANIVLGIKAELKVNSNQKLVRKKPFKFNIIYDEIENKKLETGNYFIDIDANGFLDKKGRKETDYYIYKVDVILSVDNNIISGYFRENESGYCAKANITGKIFNLNKVSLEITFIENCCKGVILYIDGEITENNYIKGVSTPRSKSKSYCKAPFGEVFIKPIISKSKRK